MGIGDWEVGNGNWRLGNGKWGMGIRDWGMETGEWRMKTGEWGLGRWGESTMRNNPNELACDSESECVFYGLQNDGNYYINIYTAKIPIQSLGWNITRIVALGRCYCSP